MQAVILAAGKGTRFGELTKTTPKSLMPVLGKPILEYTLSSLPFSIKEVLIVIGHLGNQIQNRFGSKFGKFDIKYIEAGELNGTGGAAWAAKAYIKNRFLVLSGDDIYSKGELEKLVGIKTWAAGLSKAIPQSPKYLTFELGKNNRVLGARYPSEYEMKNGILVSTGAFVLNKNIFRSSLVPIGEAGEFGLPQTILKVTRKYPTKGVLMKKWILINRTEDIIRAESLLK